MNLIYFLQIFSTSIKCCFDNSRRENSYSHSNSSCWDRDFACASTNSREDGQRECKHATCTGQTQQIPRKKIETIVWFLKNIRRNETINLFNISFYLLIITTTTNTNTLAIHFLLIFRSSVNFSTAFLRFLLYSLYSSISLFLSLRIAS